MKLDAALIGGNHPSEHPDVMKASVRADGLAKSTGEPHAVWIRPNSSTSFVVPDDSDNRLQGCVQVYSTEDGWIQIEQ